MDHTIKTLGFWIIILVAASLLWQVVRAPESASSPEITYSTFIAKAQSGEIARGPGLDSVGLR